MHGTGEEPDPAYLDATEESTSGTNRHEVNFTSRTCGWQTLEPPLRSASEDAARLAGVSKGVGRVRLGIDWGDQRQKKDLTNRMERSIF